MAASPPHREVDDATSIDLVGATATISGGSNTRGEALPLGAKAVEPRTLVSGRYRVLRAIASGGYGEVHEVLDEQTQRTCALKLTRHAGSQGFSGAALRAEFAMLSSLHHPNLADVYDFGFFGDVAFFTQALIPGVRLDRAGLDVGSSMAIELIAQLCRALEYLHGRGILHRDVKPANVLVDLEERRLVLLDFGIAQTFGSAGGQPLVGTLAYLAPEAARGAPLDARSDLYSLGVTLYKLATGDVPFPSRGRDPREVLAELATRAPPPLPASVPGPIGDVIMRLLAKEPASRFASAGEVIDALGAAVGRDFARDTLETLASYVLSASYVDATGALAKTEAICTGPDLAGPVALVGDAGTGKSRLLRELKQRLQVEGVPWISVQARLDDAAQPVRDLAEAVVTDDVARALDPQDRIEIARGVSSLRRQGERFAVPRDPERARQLRTEALGRALLLRFAGRRGVVAIEDLHRVDVSTAEQVAALVIAARNAGAPCVFLVTSRPSASVDAFARATGATVLGSEPLGPQACRQLVGATFGDAELLTGTSLGAALAHGTHSALWVQESLRLATEHGHIARRRGRFRVVSDVPALGIEEVLLARLRGLRGRGRELTLACALWGAPATAAELSGLVGGDLDLAMVELRELVRAGIAEDGRDAKERPTYAVHDRFSELVPGLFSREAVKQVHLRAAHALESAPRDAQTGAAAAAHRAAADDLVGARLAFLAAAREAEKSGRPDIALRWVDRALSVAPDRVELPDHLLRYDVATTCGARAAADASLAWLLGVESRLVSRDRFEVRVRAARRHLASGDGTQARRAASEAVELALAERDPHLEARARLIAAEADWLFGSLDGALEAYCVAAALAEESKQDDLAAQAWLGASLTGIHSGLIKDGLEYARNAVRASAGSTDLALRSDAERQLGNVTREAGHVERARTYYRAAVESGRAAGCLEREAKALNNLGTVDHWLGDVSAALEAFARSISLKERAGARSSALVGYNNIGALQNALGQFAAARATLERILSSPAADAIVVRPIALSNFGDLEAVSGRLDEAVVHYREALEASRERALRTQQTHTLANLGRTLLMRGAPGDHGEAAECLAELVELGANLEIAEVKRRISSLRSVSASVAGDHAEAVARARLAVRVEDRYTRFSDLFNTPIEARWILALALARAGLREEAAHEAQNTRTELLEMSEMFEDLDLRATYLGAHPLHAAILAGDLDLPAAHTWRRSPRISTKSMGSS